LLSLSNRIAYYLDRRGTAYCFLGWVSTAAVSMTVFLLAGCAAPQDGNQQAAAAEASVEPEAQEAAPAANPPGNPYDQPSYHSSDIINKESALWPEPLINDDPNQLLGLDKLRLDRLLGQPALVRREAPAEIWQYETENCVLDVFLYESAGVARVTYIEARDKDAELLNPRSCLNSLLKARARASLG